MRFFLVMDIHKINAMYCSRLEHFFESFSTFSLLKKLLIYAFCSPFFVKQMTIKPFFCGNFVDGKGPSSLSFLEGGVD